MHPLACHSLSELASPEPLLINAHTSATMFMLPQCRGTSQRVPVPTQAWAALFLLSLWKLLVKLHVWLSKKTYKAGGQLSFQFMSFGKKLAPWPLSPHQGMLCTPHHNDSVFSYTGTTIESGEHIQECIQSSAQLQRGNYLTSPSSPILMAQHTHYMRNLQKLQVTLQLTCVPFMDYGQKQNW